jgi:class 3 adenylate cyclase
VAAQIPGAQLVELPGDDHLPFVGDQDAILTAIERFLEGRRDTADANRVLATVVTAALREQPGRPDMRAAFEAHVRKEVEWYRGRLLDLSDAQVQASFDGPARAIRCAVALAAAAPRFHRLLQFGLHTGECEVDGPRMQGPAVELSRQLSQSATRGEVLVSRTVRDLVAGSGLAFDSRGARSLGADGQRWEVFAAQIPATEAIQSAG